MMATTQGSNVMSGNSSSPVSQATLAHLELKGAPLQALPGFTLEHNRHGRHAKRCKAKEATLWDELKLLRRKENKIRKEIEKSQLKRGSPRGKMVAQDGPGTDLTAQDGFFSELFSMPGAANAAAYAVADAAASAETMIDSAVELIKGIGDKIESIRQRLQIPPEFDIINIALSAVNLLRSISFTGILTGDTLLQAFQLARNLKIDPVSWLELFKSSQVAVPEDGSSNDPQPSTSTHPNPTPSGKGMPTAQNSPQILNVAGSVAITMLSMLFGATKINYPAVLRHLGDFGRAAIGWTKIGELIDWFTKFIKDIYYQFTLGKTLEEVELEKAFPDFVSTVRCCEHLMNPLFNRTLLQVNKELCERVLEVEESLTTMKSLSKVNDKKSVHNMCSTYLLQLRNVFELARDSPAHVHMTRKAPTVIFLSGKPGVGKTNAVDFLKAALYEKYYKDDPRWNLRNFCFTRNAENEFWDGILPDQPVVVYDDMLQNQDTIQNPNPEILELIRAKNEAPYHLHMSDIKDKKNHYFNAQFVICSSNIQGKLGSRIKSINSPQAFVRRLDLVYDVTVHPSYGIKPPGLDYYRIDPAKISPLIEPFSKDVNIFKEYNPVDGSYTAKSLTLQQFIDEVIAVHESADTKREKMLQSMYRQIGLKPPVTNNDDVDFVDQFILAQEGGPDQQTEKKEEILKRIRDGDLEAKVELNVHLGPLDPTVEYKLLRDELTTLTEAEYKKAMESAKAVGKCQFLMQALKKWKVKRKFILDRLAEEAEEEFKDSHEVLEDPEPVNFDDLEQIDLETPRRAAEKQNEEFTQRVTFIERSWEDGALPILDTREQLIFAATTCHIDNEVHYDSEEFEIPDLMYLDFQKTINKDVLAQKEAQTRLAKFYYAVALSDPVIAVRRVWHTLKNTDWWAYAKNTVKRFPYVMKHFLKSVVENLPWIMTCLRYAIIGGTFGLGMYSLFNFCRCGFGVNSLEKFRHAYCDSDCCKGQVCKYPIGSARYAAFHLRRLGSQGGVLGDLYFRWYTLLSDELAEENLEEHVKRNNKFRDILAESSETMTKQRVPARVAESNTTVTAQKVPAKVAEEREQEYEIPAPLLAQGSISRAAKAGDKVMLEQWESTTYKNMVTCENEHGMTVNGVFLTGRILLVPHHCFHGCSRISLKPISGGSPATYSLADLSTFQLTDAKEDPCDLMFVFLPKETARRSILGKIASASELYNLAESKFVISGIRTVNGQTTVYCFHADNFNYVSGFKYYHQKSDRTLSAYHGATYSVDTRPGDCGALCYAKSSKMAGRIFGMHIAGDGTNGNCLTLSQELLKRNLSAWGSLDSRAYVDARLPYAEDSSPSRPQLLPELRTDPLSNLGNCLQLGELPAPHSPTKTRLQLSAVAGTLCEPFMKPAHLKPVEIDGTLVDPMRKGISKVLNTPVNIDASLLWIAADDVSHNVLSRECNFRRVLTYEEAVSGVPGHEYLTPLNRKSSPGYPWCLSNPGSGKHHWFGDDEYIYSEEVRQEVERLLDHCRANQRGDVVWTATLKDERRPVSKVDVGKTRVFAAGPMHFTIAFRMYFLAFINHVMRHKINNEICVGTNVYSRDWHHIAMKLRQHGDKVIAGDFSEFDGSLDSDILDKILDMINDFYDDGQENVLIRRVLWEEIKNARILVNGELIQCTHSQPSGNPATVIVNSIFVAIAFRMAYLALKREEGLGLRCDFLDHVSIATYGDDVVANISDDIIEWYNQNTISSAMHGFGLKYTDECKKTDGPAYKTLEEVNFLKRKFVKDPSGWYEAPLDLDTCYEMANWIRGTSVKASTCENALNAARELTLHGKQTYEDARSKLTKAFSQKGIRERIPLYEEFRSEFDAQLWG